MENSCMLCNQSERMPEKFSISETCDYHLRKILYVMQQLDSGMFSNALDFVFNECHPMQQSIRRGKGKTEELLLTIYLLLREHRANLHIEEDFNKETGERTHSIVMWSSLDNYCIDLGSVIK